LNIPPPLFSNFFVVVVVVVVVFYVNNEKILGPQNKLLLKLKMKLKDNDLLDFYNLLLRKVY
jgi:hypothetical protein